jgi:amidase
MASSLSALRIFTKTVIDSEPWDLDPSCLRMPWNERQATLIDRGAGKKLCFAMMYDNGIVKPTPPVTRALDMTKRALESAGHAGM